MILGDPQPPMPEMATPVCAKCGGEMELGVIPDYVGRGGIMEPEWAAGKPISSFFGIQVSGRRHNVRTYRCTECGYLESYAPGR
jgi:hypothetical protein